MWKPAAIVGVLLAVAVATKVAAASERFVPDRPDFVVAKVRQAIPDAALAKLLERQHAEPSSEAAALELASAFIDRARRWREPRFMGRAEALLAPLALRANADAAARRLYADTLQYRHEFARAIRILDQLIREQPRDADSRLRRASLHLTRGDFSNARSDCAWVASLDGAASAAGFACLSEVLAGTGQLASASAMLEVMGKSLGTLPDDARAYLLSAHAALEDRAGRHERAVAIYGEALSLAPEDDSIRCAMADVIAQQGDFVRARSIVAVENPSLTLLVREAAWSAGDRREGLMRRAQEWLELEAARGDAGHAREAAILALANGDAGVAIAAARRNFELQRELTDVRMLASAAVLAQDAEALRTLRVWIADTGFADVVTENILVRRSRG
jgi:tetratricopeptide (TPR) repeat protein